MNTENITFPLHNSFMFHFLQYKIIDISFFFRNFAAKSHKPAFYIMNTGLCAENKIN